MFHGKIKHTLSVIVTLLHTEVLSIHYVHFGFLRVLLALAFIEHGGSTVTGTIPMRCPQGVKSWERTDTFSFCLYHHQFLAPRGTTVPSTMYLQKLTIKGVCPCTHVGSRVCMWRPKVNLKYHSTGATLPTLVFSHVALTGLGFAG